MIRRINVFAGPGSGKSTTAARIFAELKIRGYDVEHISEYVKTWAHEGRKPQSYDQLYIFAKQCKAEDVILRNVKLIVTDCPLLMSTAYASEYGFVGTPELISLGQQFDLDFPPLNLFIDRTVAYQQNGRFQKEDEAKQFDIHLRKFIDENVGPVFPIHVDEFDNIMTLIESFLHDHDPQRDTRSFANSQRDQAGVAEDRSGLSKFFGWLSILQTTLSGCCSLFKRSSK